MKRLALSILLSSFAALAAAQHAHHAPRGNAGRPVPGQGAVRRRGEEGRQGQPGRSPSATARSPTSAWGR